MDCFKNILQLQKMKEFHRNIIFTRTPMKGCYRFKDEFQLYPADFQNSPKSQHAKHFPIVLEFWTDDSENQIIQNYSW